MAFIGELLLMKGWPSIYTSLEIDKSGDFWLQNSGFGYNRRERKGARPSGPMLGGLDPNLRGRGCGPDLSKPLCASGAAAAAYKSTSRNR
ncbi:hypothetical protein ACSQ8B_18915 [Marinovum sp. F03]|uniref:hypothetical protein n=1 Tax=Marinovum sp. F03 TaxID=3449226 RepID=UPI003EDC3ACC